MKLKPIHATSALLFALSIFTPLSFGAEDPAPAPQFDLRQCIETALAENFDIRQARERIKQQMGTVLEARASSIPRLTGSGDYQITDEGLVQSFGPASPGNRESWNVGVQVVQDLYTGGRNRASLKSARQREAAAAADLKGVVNNVLLEVRERFYAVLLARSEIHVQEENVRLLEQELATASNKLAVGAVAPFNVLRAEVALANGRTPLIRARNNHRIAAEELRRVIGLPLQSGADLGPSIEAQGEMSFAPAQFDLNEALSKAQSLRPELQALKINIEAQRAALDVARSGNRPTLQAFGGYSWHNNNMSDDTWGDELDGWFVGGRIAWNFFDGFATKGKTMQAASALDQAKLQLAETSQAIEVETRRAYSSLTESTELVNATRKIVEQAEESVRLVNSRFDVGSATQLEVFDARVALLQARQNDHLALHDFNISLARLHKAMGTIAELQ